VQLATTSPPAVPTAKKEKPSANLNYATLKRLIKEKGLLDKQPGFAAQKMLVNAATLAISITVLFITDNLWVQMLNAAFLAFIFGQTGFIAHDVGHRQAFPKTKTNDFFGLLHADLLLGMSYGWWLDKHNQHHAHPNRQDMDPDIDFPVIAFSPEAVHDKRGLFRWMVKHQSILFFPLLLFEAFSLRAGSIAFLIQNKTWKYRKIEILLMGLHFSAFFGLVFAALGLWTGLLFIAVQQALFGFYMASVFAPNHKGMLIVGEEEEIDFLRLQVLTARNVKAHPITDFWYGGLNYQIEHHLFPSMARNKLREAQKIVRQFCREKGIEYYETSILRSYVEILQYLHEVSAPLRVAQ